MPTSPITSRRKGPLLKNIRSGGKAIVSRSFPHPIGARRRSPKKPEFKPRSRRKRSPKPHPRALRSSMRKHLGSSRLNVPRKKVVAIMSEDKDKQRSISYIRRADTE